MEGSTVATNNNTVTAISLNGFYMQTPDARADANPNTSEGIFVFTSSAPTVNVGDNISVFGTVTEFRPGDSGSANLEITEITSPSILLLSTGNPLPAASVLGNGGRTIPTTIINDGINFYESLEGILVQINISLVISPSNSLDEIWVLADNGVNSTSRTARGGSLLSSTDYNPERIQLDGLPGVSLPIVDVVAQLNTIEGVISYSFGNFEVLVSSAPTIATPSTLTKEETDVTGTSDKLTVSTLDLNNIDLSDGAVRFDAFADMVVSNLKSPDIIIVTTIQDNNGATNNGVVDATITFQTLIDSITAAGGPAYQYRQISPVNNNDGGEPGGNIRQGFLFNPSRVTFTDRPGGTSTTSTGVNNISGVPTLSVSPGRIDPTNAAFNYSRKP